MGRARSSVLLVAMLVAGVACTGDGGGADVTGPTGATATQGPTSTGSPTTSGGPGGQLADGRHFGFVRSVDVAGLSVEVDLADFLTGDEANEAAEAHGDETPVPNDAYIVNDERRVRTLGLAPDLELVLLDWDRCCDETFLGQLQDFAAAVNGGEPVTVDGRRYQGTSSPYWVTVEGGVVTTIEEQYLP